MPIFVKQHMRKGKQVRAYQRPDTPKLRKLKTEKAKAARERAWKIQAYRKRG